MASRLLLLARGCFRFEAFELKTELKVQHDVRLLCQLACINLEVPSCFLWSLQDFSLHTNLQLAQQILSSLNVF